MAESIGLASGHPPAWFDTEDDGLGNWAGKAIRVSGSALCASVPRDLGGCYGSLIRERMGLPDRPMTRPVRSTGSRWPARQAARNGCAGESASILFGGVANCRHGTAGNSTDRQLGGVTGRGQTSHRTKSAKVKAPLGNLAVTPPCTVGDSATGEAPLVIRNSLETSHRSVLGISPMPVAGASKTIPLIHLVVSTT